VCQIQERMKQDLTSQGLAESTCAMYLCYARAFVVHFKRSPRELGAEHVRAWLLHLLTVRNGRPSTVNVAMAALMFLYGTTLSRPEVTRGLRRVRRSFPEPDVLSGSEVSALIEHAPTLKHKAIFMLMYSAGLRVSEVLALKASDIHSKRMVVHVRAPKNRHDRVVPLSPRTLTVLREYFRGLRQRGEYLFPGQSVKAPITRLAVHLALKQAAGRARIAKRVHPHLLRHAFATHMIESRRGHPHRSELTRSSLAAEHGAVYPFVRSTAPFDKEPHRGIGHRGGAQTRIAVHGRARVYRPHTGAGRSCAGR